MVFGDKVTRLAIKGKYVAASEQRPITNCHNQDKPLKCANFPINVKTSAGKENSFVLTMADILALRCPLHTLPENANAQMTSRALAVLRSTFLALKASLST
jgi:hypothetical protein